MIYTYETQGSGSGSGGGSTKPQKLCVPVDGYSWYCQYGQICGNREGVCLGVLAGGSGSGSGSGISPTATGSTSSRTTSARPLYLVLPTQDRAGDRRTQVLALLLKASVRLRYIGIAL